MQFLLEDFLSSSILLLLYAVRIQDPDVSRVLLVFSSKFLFTESLYITENEIGYWKWIKWSMGSLDLEKVDESTKYLIF